MNPTQLNPITIELDQEPDLLSKIIDETLAKNVKVVKNSLARKRLNLLQQVKELFSNPDNWCIGFLCLNKQGYPTEPSSSKAIKWCLDGGCLKFCGFSKDERSSAPEAFAIWNLSNKYYVLNEKTDEFNKLTEKQQIYFSTVYRLHQLCWRKYNMPLWDVNNCLKLEAVNYILDLAIAQTQEEIEIEERVSI